jgi:hypothetical protein
VSRRLDYYWPIASSWALKLQFEQRIFILRTSGIIPAVWFRVSFFVVCMERREHFLISLHSHWSSNKKYSRRTSTQLFYQWAEFAARAPLFACVVHASTPSNLKPISRMHMHTHIYSSTRSPLAWHRGASPYCNSQLAAFILSLHATFECWASALSIFYFLAGSFIYWAFQRIVRSKCHTRSRMIWKEDACLLRPFLVSPIGQMSRRVCVRRRSAPLFMAPLLTTLDCGSLSW